jgi:toxin CptA
MSSAPTITFDVRSSRLLALAVALMTLLAVVAVALARLPLALKLALGIAIVVYAALSLRRLRRPPLRAVGWHGDDTWTLHLAGGGKAYGRLRSARKLGPLIVLRLAWPQGGATSLTLLPDSIDADTRRRLRVRLSAIADGN